MGEAMRDPSFVGRLPEGYEVESGPPGVLALSREFAPALRGAGYGLESDGAARRSALSGRKPLLELTTSAGVFLVRRFAHGGLLRFLTRERYRDPSRPFRELSLSCSLARAGVGTPAVAAARARPAPGWGWNLEIVTQRVEGAFDLDEALALAASGRIDRSALRRAVAAAGRLVRALHGAGCRHADLTTKNMLVERVLPRGGDPRTWILDLDGASLVPGLTDAERRSSLTRLFRYVLRRERRRGPALARTDWARFLRAYEPDRQRRRAHARAILASHARSLPWHGLGWKLEELLAPK